jgi:hypothetical protein
VVAGLLDLRPGPKPRLGSHRGPNFTAADARSAYKKPFAGCRPALLQQMIMSPVFTARHSIITSPFVARATRSRLTRVPRSDPANPNDRTAVLSIRLPPVRSQVIHLGSPYGAVRLTDEREAPGGATSPGTGRVAEHEQRCVRSCPSTIPRPRPLSGSLASAPNSSTRRAEPFPALRDPYVRAAGQRQPA